MANDRGKLIESLVHDMTPVTTRGALLWPAATWWGLSWLWVVAATLTFGPLRPGAMAELVAVPQFALESLIGFLAGAFITWIAFAESVPGMNRRSLTMLALGAAGLWVLSYVIGFVHPALEPSMFGKRAHCVVETLVYSVPPIAAGVWFLRRRFTLRNVRAGALMGLAAGMLPALLMQIACMYSPEHALVFHIGPALLMGGAGAVGGGLLARPR